MAGPTAVPVPDPTHDSPAAAAAPLAALFPESFALERYFVGRTRAWGMVQDRFGRVRRRFVVDMNGSWDGSLLVLEEDFLYDNDSRSHRTWRVRKTGPSSYAGEAADVVGKAAGQVDGPVLTWRYRLRLLLGRRVWTVRFHDVMYLQDDAVMINRAVMRMFGLRLGELTIVFRRVDATMPVSSWAAAGG
jgi:hypothetical protein